MFVDSEGELEDSGEEEGELVNGSDVVWGKGEELGEDVDEHEGEEETFELKEGEGEWEEKGDWGEGLGDDEEEEDVDSEGECAVREGDCVIAFWKSKSSIRLEEYSPRIAGSTCCMVTVQYK